MSATKTVLRTPARAMVAVMTFTGDDSYPEGGYPLHAIDFTFTELSGIFVQKVRSGDQFLEAHWDPDTERLLFYYPTGGSSTAPTTPADPELSSVDDLVEVSTVMQKEPYASLERAPGVELDLELEGEGLVIDTTNSMTPGGGKELPEGADLSGVTARVLAMGY